MSESKANDEYVRLLRYLEYTLHELPAGVLYDANGADEKKCAELMRDTYRLEKLEKALALIFQSLSPRAGGTMSAIRTT